MVRYFFQRPQTDPDFQNYNKHSRWALGDDSVLEVRPNDTSELVSEFQALDIENDGFASTKKIWGMEEHNPQMKHPDDPKGLFLGEPQWGRDSTWSTGGHNENASDHAVSQPIMVNSRRSGSYPGSDQPLMLSPRSTDTGGLGVKMVEYVLGSSPTAKDLDGRMHSRLKAMEKHKQQMKGGYDESKMHHKDPHSNGMTNGTMGLDDENKGFSRTPGFNQLDDEDVKNQMIVNEMSKMKGSDGMHVGMPGNMMAGGHGGPQHFDFDPNMSINEIQFGDYTSQMIHSIDSPGIVDYNSPYQRSNQQTGQMPAAMLASHAQQFNLAQQQSQGMPPHTNPGMGGPNGAGNNPFPPQTPYYGTDPFSASMGHIIPAGPPPAMLAQYYGMPPWGMYPGMIQSNQVQSGSTAPHIQQQQQMMSRSNGTRPLTPQGPSDNSGTPQAMQA
ncbi:unnamed protein product, partial [Medioppia subpectinata]